MFGELRKFIIILLIAYAVYLALPILQIHGAFEQILSDDFWVPQIQLLIAVTGLFSLLFYQPIFQFFKIHDSTKEITGKIFATELDYVAWFLVSTTMLYLGTKSLHLPSHGLIYVLLLFYGFAGIPWGRTWWSGLAHGLSLSLIWIIWEVAIYGTTHPSFIFRFLLVISTIFVGLSVLPWNTIVSIIRIATFPLRWFWGLLESRLMIQLGKEMTSGEPFKFVGALGTLCLITLRTKFITLIRWPFRKIWPISPQVDSDELLLKYIDVKDSPGVTPKDKLFRKLFTIYRVAKGYQRPSLSSDHENSYDDLLDRDNFINRLFKQVYSYLYSSEDVPPFALALKGEWGDGKSWVINKLIEKISLETPNIIVVKTFPCRYSLSVSNEQLLTGLYKDLEFAIGQKVRVFHLSKYLRQFISLLTTTFNSKAGIGLNLQLIADEAISYDTSKKRIHELLKESHLKLLIILEDLDRMEADELLKVLYLLRFNFDFRNVMFVLPMAPAEINKSLAKLGLEQKFLEKFIQHEEYLPPIRSDVIIQQIKEDLRDYWHQESFYNQTAINEAIDQVFSIESIYSLISNIRQAKRLLNGIKLSYSSLQGEINLIDYMYLELIKQYFPNVYQDIVEHSYYYLPGLNRQWHSDVLKSESRQQFNKKHLEKLLEGTEDTRKRVCMDILKQLFTNLLESSLYSSNNREYRLEDPRYFLRYFEGKVAADQFANAEALAMIPECLSSPDAQQFLRNHLNQMMDQKRFHDFFVLVLTKLKKDIVPEAFFILLFTELAERENGYASQFDREQVGLVQILQSLLVKINITTATSLIKSVVAKANLFTAFLLIHYLQLDIERGNEEALRTLPEGFLVKQRKTLVDRFLQEFIKTKTNFFAVMDKRHIKLVWTLLLQWKIKNTQITEYIYKLLKNNSDAQTTFAQVYHSGMHGYKWDGDTLAFLSQYEKFIAKLKKEVRFSQSKDFKELIEYLSTKYHTEK